MKVNKYSFNENVFGEQIEYILIEDEKEKIVIVEYYNKIHIIKIENEKQLLERLIECKILNDYLQEIIQEQDEEITEYENNSDMEE